MRKHKQNGFTIIETALVLVTLFVLGFTAWLVWQKKQSSDNKLTKTVGISASKSKQQPQKQTSASTLTPTAATIAPTTSQATPPSTTQKKKPATTSTPVIVHPTADEITQAKNQALAIKGLIEAYNATNNTYPWSLDANALLAGQDANSSVFNAPAGTYFYYQCMKGGGTQCTAYQLQVLKTDGTLLDTIKNY